MPVYGAFASSTLGMMSQSHALNTIGVNIANVTTGGYKRTETRFSTLLGENFDNQSDLGGVRPKDSQFIDSQGFLTTTVSNTDVAINGHGFFVVNTKFSGGQTLYTRDGSFGLKTEGTATVTADDGSPITVKKAFLADKNGYFVQGILPDAKGNFPISGALSPLRLDQFAFSTAGQATTEAKLHINLSATDTSSVSQVDNVTLAGTVEAGEKYNVTVDGKTVTYTVTAADANLDAVRDKLVAAVNADSTVGAVVTATASTSGKLNLTAKTGGTAFTSSSAATNGGATADNTMATTTSRANKVGSVRPYATEVFDSKGTKQTATLEFTKGAVVNQWSVTATTSQAPVAQVDSVTLGGTAEAADTYSVTVNANTITYTVTGADANLDAVRDKLVAAINADPTVSAAVTAAPGSAGALTLTAKTAGTAFTATSAATNGGATADNTATISTTTANAGTTKKTAPVTLTFDERGQIKSPTTLNLALSWDNGGSATVALDMSLMTQFAGDFTPFLYSKNGFAKADMIDFDFDTNGHIVGNFDDATNRRLYRLPLAVFSNPNGLEMKNGNTFAESPESGKRRVVVPGSGGFALLTPNALELSNVNLIDEFARMIRTQAAYNSSATVFRTVDEMVQAARDLKR